MRKSKKKLRKSQLIPTKGNGMWFLVQFVSFQGGSPVLHTLVISSELLNYSEWSFSIR